MSWFPRKKVLVPIDFSEESFQAVDTALSLVNETASLHVIHVLPDLAASEPGAIWGEVNEESRHKNALQALADHLKEDRYAGIQMHVTWGNPGHEITLYAEEIEADLIVMPSHGRTGLKRLLIGSVAERTVRLAHCPVLVLRS